jgi:small subunit ribosomal protein S1
LAEVSGIPAFLPTSQLSFENYPKVEGGESQKILKELQKLIGKEFEVKIFDLDQKENKLILSEKTKEDERIKEALKNFKVGDVVEGEITGIVDFGAFIKFNSSVSATDEKPPLNLEGLIHISELDWQLVKDPSEIVKIGEIVKAKIIDISNGKVSLSLKALKENPWLNIKLKKGDIVKGKVTKFNPFGAFVQLILDSDRTETIQGLCHISEFGTQEKMEEALKIGKEYDFQILSLDLLEHKISLKIAA